MKIPNPDKPELTIDYLILNICAWGPGLTKWISTVGLVIVMAMTLHGNHGLVSRRILSCDCLGNGGQKIFRDFEDDERYFGFLRNTKSVLVFCCMPVRWCLPMFIFRWKWKRQSEGKVFFCLWYFDPGAYRFGKYFVKHIEGFIAQQHALSS